jgi:hypothetical protein
MTEEQPLEMVYEIRLQGHLDERRAQQFEGLTLTLLPTGETVLTGPVVDQPALHGILARIRDMGVQLLGVAIQERRSVDGAGSEGDLKGEENVLANCKE